MGTTYRFQCPSCKYVAVVSGGPDEGWFNGTHTMVCHDCKRLVDVLTSYDFDEEDKDPDREYRTDEGWDEWYHRLFEEKAVLLAMEASGKGANRKRACCPICGCKVKSVGKILHINKRIWNKLCPACALIIRKQVYVECMLGFEYLSMTENAKKQGMKQKSQHCPICGKTIAEPYQSYFGTTRDGTQPCPKCESKIRERVRKDLRTARDELNACPRCEGKNLTEWKAAEDGSGPCPKCGGTMLKGELVALYD